MMPGEPHRTPEADALEHALTALYQKDADLPRGYAEAWRGAIRREERNNMKKQPGRFWKAALPVAAALVLVIGALSVNDGALSPSVTRSDSAASRSASYAAKSSGENTSGIESASDEAMPMAMYSVNSSMDSGMMAGGATDATADAASVLPAGAKLVRTADLTLTTGQFDGDQQRLLAQVASVGGYVESSYVTGDVASNRPRRGSYTLRVPSARLDEFLAYAEGLARVTNRSETATDMTTQYADSQTRLQTQQTKMERLQALLAQATQMSDIIELESAIADTQYQLDWYQTQLKQIDNQVDLSAVTVTLNEESTVGAAQAEELPLGERIRKGFESSIRGLGRFFQNMLVFVVMASPVLAGACVLGVIVWLLVRAKRRKHSGNGPSDGVEHE